MCQTVAAPSLAPTSPPVGVAPLGGQTATLDGVISQLASATQQLRGIVDAMAVQLSPMGGGPAGGTGCPCNPVGSAVAGAASTAGIPPVPPPPSGPIPGAEPAAPPVPTAAAAPAADVGKWVTGDTDGLNPELLNKLAQLGEKMGKKVSVTSGHRSREEQEVLYQKYLNGTGNLAAKPGTSNHESGNAADVKMEGVSVADFPGAKDAAAALGMGFPVPGEPWHIEIT